MSHTHTHKLFWLLFLFYKSRNNRRVCLSCLLYIRKGERNSFSRMSWYFRCCPGSCFCFVFLSFPFRLSCGHLQRSGFLKRERERERTSWCCTCVMAGRPSTVNFFFQENNIGSRRRKKKILLTSFVCFGSAPAIRPRCDEFNAFEWGGPSTFFPPPPFYWSLLVRGITHRHEQLTVCVCCVWWSYPLRQEGLRSNGNIFHFQLLDEFLKKEKTYRLNDEENDPVFIKQKKFTTVAGCDRLSSYATFPEQQQQQLVRF